MNNFGLNLEIEQRKRLSGNVRRRRKQLKLTQEQLAEKAGIASRTLADIEAGRTLSPGIIPVSNIAIALGCKVDDLLYEQDIDAEEYTSEMSREKMDQLEKEMNSFYQLMGRTLGYFERLRNLE